MDSVHRLNYSQGRPAQPQGPTPTHQGPPPQAAPPSYFAAVRRRVPASLRPVLLVATFISFLYLVIAAVASFRYIGATHETAKLRTFDVIAGILYVVGALAEAFGFYAIWTRKRPLVTMYARLSLFALAIIVGAQVVNIVSHFAGKSDIISGCTQKYTGATACSGYSSWWGGWSCSETEPLSASDAASYCENLWKKESTWIFVWLAIILILGAVFVALAFAFLRQLQDPSWRTRSTQTGPPGAYSNAFTYDDESSPFDTRTPGAQGRYSYDQEPQYYAGAGAHSYPPPPGAPPTDEVPQYEPPAGRKSMASVDLDRKDPNIASYSNYTSGGDGHGHDEDRPQYNRPGSSRSVYRGEEDVNTNSPDIRPVRPRENSEDTVKGADDVDGTHAKV
ncbi:unnamed protein product [Parajaminaea phylloscopi]